MELGIGVSVIAHTQADWHKFLGASIQCFGQSPTRDLDAHKVQVGNPGSYAMALEVLNGRYQAVTDLSKAYRSLEFIHFTFLMAFEDCDVADAARNMLQVSTIQFSQRSSSTIICCGNIKQWKEFIVCTSEMEQFRKLSNMLYELLCDYGFKSLFGVKKGMPDGSFILPA